jgi:UDP-N-acetylmuramate dehydrogenase
MAALRAHFGNRLQENVRLANYTTARVGGPVDALIIVNNIDELVEAAQFVWQSGNPLHLFGSGSNVLVSDQGLPGVVIINHAHTVKIDSHHTPPSVWAEAGANFSSLARQVAARGLSGLEWAAAIPGSLGGAVYGNAGAFGGDIASSLLLAEILHREQGRETLTNEQMGYSYRSSILKRSRSEDVIILAARLKLENAEREIVQQKMSTYLAKRRSSQPPGASMGSMFKNPPEDYAGRLIEAAGLKGKRIGGAEISPIHANFFITDNTAKAMDVFKLVDFVKNTVKQKFGVELELEVELVGEF